MFELVYDEFRRLARKYTKETFSSDTLQPTEVVHEAFLKLVDQQQVDWRGKSHFLAVGAKAMRHILVDHAKREGRKKRGGAARLARPPKGDWKGGRAAPAQPRRPAS